MQVAWHRQGAGKRRRAISARSWADGRHRDRRRKTSSRAVCDEIRMPTEIDGVRSGGREDDSPAAGLGFEPKGSSFGSNGAEVRWVPTNRRQRWRSSR